jgi:hypothetical protein
MQLSEIREKFVQFSGRYDLINSDDTDNGANFFINSGQRFLDRRIDFKKSSGRFFEQVAAGTWYFKLADCRSLDKVWVTNGEERWELERKSLHWLHSEFPNLISATDQGDPLYWTPAMLRGIDITDITAGGTFFNYALAEAANEEYTGIVFLPPPDETMTIEIWGKFYSPTLASDSDESYWSVVVPETLIQAGLYRLETFYRNTEGAKDWLLAIDLDLTDIDKDLVHEDNVNVDQMEN